VSEDLKIPALKETVFNLCDTSVTTLAEYELSEKRLADVSNQTRKLAKEPKATDKDFPWERSTNTKDHLQKEPHNFKIMNNATITAVGPLSDGTYLFKSVFLPNMENIPDNMKFTPSALVDHVKKKQPIPTCSTCTTRPSGERRRSLVKCTAAGHTK
jgi:hypothetical protein